MMELSGRSRQLRPSPIREIFNHAPAGAINLGLGELKFPLHPFIKEAGFRALERGDITYTPNAGLPLLRRKLAEHYGVDPGNICVTCGAEEAIFIALAAIIEPGDSVLVPDPGYLAYPNLVRYYRGVPLPYRFDPENHFQLDRANLADHRNIKAVIVCNPSNPLGTALSEPDRSAIIDFCRKNDVWLIVDEVYRELFHGTRPESFSGSFEKCIVISALSKSHAMTGWRLGWLNASKELIQAATRIHQYTATCAPRISQEVAVDLFSEYGWRVNEQLRHKLAANREIVLHKLSGWDILPNDAAPYMFVKVEGPDSDFVKRLLAEGVITVPGSAFGEMGRGWIRISYGVTENELRKGLERIILC